MQVVVYAVRGTSLVFAAPELQRWRVIVWFSHSCSHDMAMLWCWLDRGRFCVRSQEVEWSNQRLCQLAVTPEQMPKQTATTKQIETGRAMARSYLFSEWWRNRAKLLWMFFYLGERRLNIILFKCSKSSHRRLQQPPMWWFGAFLAPVLLTVVRDSHWPKADQRLVGQHLQSRTCVSSIYSLSSKSLLDCHPRGLMQTTHREMCGTGLVMTA